MPSGSAELTFLFESVDDAVAAVPRRGPLAGHRDDEVEDSTPVARIGTDSSGLPIGTEHEQVDDSTRALDACR